jgi:DNA polymerase-3 subunit delta'
LEDISRNVLLGAAASGRIPNAYLFVGADPKALLDEAVFFARVLNCTSKAELPCSPDSIGQCESCGKISRNCHPDLLILRSGGKSIKIDEIRQVTDFVKFGTSLSKWKVIVINGADLMTEEASNSFLKTLEEPLDNILFILTTVRESKILRTIVSRCQKLAFYNEEAASDENVQDLTDKILNIEDISIPQILAVSEELSYDADLDEKLNSVLYEYRRKIDINSTKKFLAAREIFIALRSIERKANKRLAMDTMFLSLKGVAQD